MKEKLHFIIPFVILITVLIANGTLAAAPTDSTNAPPTYDVGQPIPERRVAVMNLTVQGDHADLVRDWLPTEIEDRLLAVGWTLVVRGERMQHIQQEQNLPGIKPGTEPQKNELLGATALLELTARVKIQEFRGIAGVGIFGGAEVATASIDLNGQITDPSTGVLKASIGVSGSDTGLKSLLFVNLGSKIGGLGYDIKNIRQSLIGKAADKAVVKLVDRLIYIYPRVPIGAPAAQSSFTSIGVDSGTVPVILSLPPNSNARPGDRYGIYRENCLIAEVEIINITGTQAQVRVLSQSSTPISTDIARKMPVVIQVQ